MNFTKRRLRNTAILLVLSIITLLVFHVISLSLLTQQYYSGWLMAGVTLGLLAFYIKKKLSVVPLGKTAHWAQWHYYGGCYLAIVFLIHIEFSIPDGYIEGLLASLLVIVTLVGIGGLIINRIFARRLAYLDEEIIFERISQHRTKLKVRLEKQLIESVERSHSSTLSDYYVEHLASYFSAPSDTFSILIGNRQPHLRRLHGLDRQMRYLNKTEADFAMQLEGFIEQKNTLDNHYALQGVLKYWGLLHAPLGVVMSFLILVHIVLVYGFRGAA